MIGFYVYSDKMEFICFKKQGGIYTLNNGSIKLVDTFTCFRNSILSTGNQYVTRERMDC